MTIYEVIFQTLRIFANFCWNFKHYLSYSDIEEDNATIQEIEKPKQVGQTLYYI